MITLPTGLNFILLTIVIVASTITILQTLRDSITNSPRWIPISVGLLVFALSALWFVPAVAGYLSTTLWVLFAVVPSLGFRLSNHLHYRGRYADARRVKRWLRWLHPLRDWPWQDALFQAHIDMHNGRRGQATALLQNALNLVEITPEREVLIFVMSHDWHGLVAWWETHPQRDRLEARPDVIRHYIRALGETGQLDEMVATFLSYQQVIDRVPLVLNYAYLYLFAFGGKVQQTTMILDDRLSEMINPDMQIVWLATAHAATDNLEMSKALLRPLLRTTKDGLTKFNIEQRLSRDLARAGEVLSTATDEQLCQISKQWTERNQMLTRWH